MIRVTPGRLAATQLQAEVDDKTVADAKRPV
jgi:hypothetical protein